MYSSFTFAVSFMPTFFYNYYCRKHFKECAFRCGYDKEIFKNMVGFSGWNTLGCLSGMGQGAGINLILNAFCGTVINGARGIALGCKTSLYQFPSLLPHKSCSEIHSTHLLHSSWLGQR